jgi:hypothetical protein
MEQIVEVTITQVVQNITITISQGAPGTPGIVDYNLVIAYSVAL